jgi:protein phosphatase
MRFAAATDIGKARTTNEDAFLACPISDGLFLAAVADGMGGGEAGGEASRMALNAFRETLSSLVDRGASLEGAIGQAASRANTRILKRSMARFGYPGMGTTLTATVVQPGGFHVCHVGDSRAYVVGNGSARQVTRDHSLVAEMVRQGDITEDEAMVHPQRNVLTQALGTRARVLVDLEEFRTGRGDLILICTDGLSGLVNREEIAKVIASARHLEDAAASLVRLANERGGHDNITVVLVEPGGEDSC